MLLKPLPKVIRMSRVKHTLLAITDNISKEHLANIIGVNSIVNS